jgi:hypothetical protein
MLKEGITNWLAKGRPLLTPEVVKKRLQFWKSMKIGHTRSGAK